MTQPALLTAALVLGAAVLVSGHFASAGEIRIEGPTGVRVGRIVPMPDGQIYLQDRMGKRVGRLRPRPDGGYGLNDKAGAQLFTVMPKNRAAR